MAWGEIVFERSNAQYKVFELKIIFYLFDRITRCVRVLQVQGWKQRYSTVLQLEAIANMLLYLYSILFNCVPADNLRDFYLNRTNTDIV